MKNIAHFATGLALASFVPGVMEDAGRGSLLIALGGLCAMLPDTLDFRFVRYLERPDANIAPDPAQPDPQQIADGIAMQMWLAASGKRPRIVHLRPARFSVTEWVLYTVRFDTAAGDVTVVMDRDGASASAHVGRMDYTYEGDLHVEELGGPSLRFSDTGNGIQIEFLPWHRVWTHSLLIALALGLLLGWLIEPRAGLVAGLGYAGHVLEDQLGYMGSALFAPLLRKRGSGLGLLHSGDAIPNIVTVWLSLSLLLLNMDRARVAPSISVGPYLAFGVLLPSVVMLGIYARRRWKTHLAHVEAERQRDIVAEAQEYQT
ncbi:MAG: metal-dependent hydrolase [Chloroflexi bacterium]|nr:metal-dependent hydrolase [Chloroflexota bacterium]MCL5274052.1 metal-dependent hydrolase [Chloroflexota bacterium]